jgi:peroxiredoxin Q/BCP
MISVGDRIPEFTLASDTAGTVSPQALLGKRYVLYVYPKDDTSG